MCNYYVVMCYACKNLNSKFENPKSNFRIQNSDFVLR